MNLTEKVATLVPFSLSTVCLRLLNSLPSKPSILHSCIFVIFHSRSFVVNLFKLLFIDFLSFFVIVYSADVKPVFVYLILRNLDILRK